MTNPRFYTTSKDAVRTANEIGETLAKYGAKQYSLSFDSVDGIRQPTGLHFIMEVPDVGEVPVELKAQVEGIVRRLNSNRSTRGISAHRKQAYRVAWRQLLAYVEMMLEMVKNDMKPFHEAFMADVLIHRGGGEWLRLGEAYREARGQLSLPAPTIDAEYDEVEA